MVFFTFDTAWFGVQGGITGSYGRLFSAKMAMSFDES